MISCYVHKDEVLDVRIPNTIYDGRYAADEANKGISVFIIHTSFRHTHLVSK